MTRIVKIFLGAVLAVALLGSTALAQVPARPANAYAVNDFAQIFTQGQWQRLEKRLVDFADSTSNQIVVVTVADLGGMEPAMFAYEIGEKWGVGSREYNNGVVILVKPKTMSSRGQAYISVGYGLEGAIPDAIASRILDNEMIPYFQENDYYGGINAALDVILPLAAGEYTYQQYEKEGMIETLAAFVFMLVMLVVLYLIAKKNHKNGGGPGSSGGGMSVGDAIFWSSLLGGGRSGRSGGGGFSGGFGGGFGGGSFGGGGAGRSW